MDLFYSDYKTDNQFLDLQDFIFHCSNTVSDLYLQEYRVLRAEMRQEKKDEVVAFSNEWLASVILDIEANGQQEFSVKMPENVMSFPYDNQNIGVQDVTPIVPRGTSLQRSNQTEYWQYRYLPNSNEIFWRLEGDKIFFYRSGGCTLSKVKVYYVPSGDANSLVPDAIANYVITTTVMNIKQIQAGVVIDKTADGNNNKIIQSEINTNSLKN